MQEKGIELLGNKISLDVPMDSFPMSYSRLNTYENCPLRYSYHYNKHIIGKDEQTIALDVGTLCHKILELKALMVLGGITVDYEWLKECINEGWSADGETVLGIKDLKKKYGIMDWHAPNDVGDSYETKMKRFIEHTIYDEVPDGTQEDGWRVCLTEHPFNYCYDAECADGTHQLINFTGFIDRVDVREHKGFLQYRVVDYKTSKKVYDSRTLATPLQQIIYGMFIYLETNKLPHEYQYSFVLLDETRTACTPGYLSRGLKRMDKLFSKMFENAEQDEWMAKPSPLCYYCPYREDGVIQDPLTMHVCKSYCLWTPTNKTFEVYNDTFANKEEDKPKRKLIF